MLESVWIRHRTPGNGTLYILSGFGNYNGGVRFYPALARHCHNGGNLVAIFAGSTSQRLTSQQVVSELLSCGARVLVINRKRLFHAKFYGRDDESGATLVTSSGNFTAPGMSQNVELSVYLDPTETDSAGFSWPDVVDQVTRQSWQIYEPKLSDPSDPAWDLLYDETRSPPAREESTEVSLILLLGHADTARIQAAPNTTEARGTQYFWLSTDCYDFFPALTILNARGVKKTYSTLVTLHYLDLGVTDHGCRVTFEAENNLDFRLLTSKLRCTKLAKEGDMAVIRRIADREYELRLVDQTSTTFSNLSKYATTFIGHKGKRYGFIDNNTLSQHI